ncbi:MAG: BCCT family transporter, partial [Myxococcota bacterium]
PMYHFTSVPPLFLGVEAGTEAAVRPALAQSFLHWGFLAWAVVGSLGAIVLMVLNDTRGVPLRPRALLVPVVGDRLIESPLGSVVDAVCIVAALAGTIGPIGFLALQLSYSAEVMLGIPDGYATQLVVLTALTGVATLSAVSGVHKGIRVLSQINVWLALLLAVAMLVLGPTLFILQEFVLGFGVYLISLPWMATYVGDPGWLGYWTVFYWGWFIGYGPLMCLFVARISRGRTVREIVLGVCVVAPLLTNLWFTILGGSGIAFELAQAGAISGPLKEAGLPAALFAIVGQVPGGGVLMVAFVVLIFVFLATSADSMAYSASMVVSGRFVPPGWMRALWGVLMGVVAGLLLGLGEGAIRALQSFIVVTAVPVSAIMATCVVTAPLLLWRARKQLQARTDGDTSTT